MLAENLAALAQHLDRLQHETGRLIYVCLEPEPGCALQRSSDVVQFFEQFLLPGRDERHLRRHLRVCHDVCHAAVMFEDQAEASTLHRRRNRDRQSPGVVGRRAEPGRIGYRGSAARAGQLRRFHEDRYLHQTCVRSTAGAEPAFFEDLPMALQTVEDGRTLQGQWRVHFHVPIYVERFGWLSTSQADIAACLQAVRRCPELRHFEIERTLGRCARTAAASYAGRRYRGGDSLVSDAAE